MVNVNTNPKLYRNLIIYNEQESLHRIMMVKISESIYKRNLTSLESSKIIDPTYDQI
jgi:hypothetical protein